MKTIKTKSVVLSLLFVMAFSFVPISSQALTYSDIQPGKVLGNSTAYPYPSGSLVNENGTIYFISGTTKVPFTNWQAFIGLGYSLRNVTNGNLQNYMLSTNYFITTANADHPWGSWLLYNGTVYYSTESGLIGVPSYQTFVQNGGNWKYVVRANKYDITVLNANRNLPLLSTGDARIYGQPAYAFQPTQDMPSSNSSTGSNTQNQTGGQQTNNQTTSNPQNQTTSQTGNQTTTTPASTVITPAQKLSTNGIRSVTFNIPGEDLGGTDQFYNDLSAALPKIKDTGFNTVWLVNWWQVFEPTALPQASYSTDAFNKLRKVLDLLRANNMKAILGINYLGGYRAPQGVDGLNWIQNPQQYQAFESYVARYLTEIRSYNDMAYIMVFTENSEPSGMADQAHAQQVAGLLRPTLGSMPTRLPQDLRNLFTIGYHDYSIINLGWGNGQSPIANPNSYDFVSMVAYGQDLLPYADINTELAARAQRFKALYPNTPLMIGELGGDFCNNNEENQARVDGTIISYALNKNMGFNVWGWPNQGACGDTNNDTFALTNPDKTLRQSTQILKKVLSGDSTVQPWLVLPAPENAVPVGQLETVGNDGKVLGWAYDPDEPSLAINVAIYVDGQQAENINANILRTDINTAQKIQGSHGFIWTIPQKYKDGKQHTLTAFGRDTSYDGRRNAQLTNSLTFAFNSDGTAAQVGGAKDQAILKDLQYIKSLGINRIRVLTFVRYPGDSTYVTWPGNVFISFPKPTDQELAALKHYLSLVDQAGLHYEFVYNMADSKQKFYTYGITSQDYKNFIDAVWQNIWGGKLDRIVVGGDLSLNPVQGIDSNNPDTFPAGSNVVSSQRQWVQDIWPYVYNKCPTCNMGVEFLSQYATLWDQGVSSTQWAKANLTPQPKFYAYQFYPTTRAWMTPTYVSGNGYNWLKLAQDWSAGVMAASSNVPAIANEVGLPTEGDWTAQDQSDFLTTVIPYLANLGMPVTMWEYADHGKLGVGTGLYGLVDSSLTAKPSATALKNSLANVNSSLVGIHYNPPDSVGWQFIMP